MFPTVIRWSKSGQNPTFAAWGLLEWIYRRLIEQSGVANCRSSYRLQKSGAP
jgi:hypothetical protein